MVNTVDYKYGFVINVIDNGSTDGSKDYLRSLPQDWPVKAHCLGRNLGVSGGRNFGMSLTAGKSNTFYWSNDNDMVPLKKNWITRIIEASMAQPIVRLISYPMFGANDYARLEIKDCNGFKLAEVDPLWLGGYLMGIPPMTFKKIGYFDFEHSRDSYLSQYTQERVLFGVEDTLYAHRVKLAGGKIYYMEEPGMFQNIQRDILEPVNPERKPSDRTKTTNSQYENFKHTELERIEKERLFERLCEAYSSCEKPLKI